MRGGRALPNELVVDLIAKRVQMADALQNGWVLDGYPQTRDQAILLTQKGLVPTSAFVLKLNNFDVKLRVEKARRALEA